MLSLDPKKLAEMSIPVATSWLLGSCMEARGKQDLWMRQKPEVLEVLREQAIIQSVESSNRIEGVTIPADRLRPVVMGKAQPRITTSPSNIIPEVYQVPPHGKGLRSTPAS